MTSTLLAMVAIPAAAMLLAPGPHPVAATKQVRPAPPPATYVTKQGAVTIIKDTSGIEGVVAYADPAHTHVMGPVVYATTPPMGGPHNPQWMNAGVYTVPVPSERAVHDMEHGVIWITYQPSLPPDQVAQLTQFVGEQTLIPEGKSATGLPQSNRFMDLSPWSSFDPTPLPAPIVVTSWAHQLYLYSATDPRLQQFVDTFRRSKTYTPEVNEPVDDQPVTIGGRAAQYGGTAPNPPNRKIPRPPPGRGRH